MADPLHPLLAVIMFASGIVIVIWATERFLEGLVGVATLARVSTFTIAAVLSGFEAENVAVGVASGAEGVASLALGTVFGGAIFLVCVALGLAAVLFPLRVRLPRSLLLIFAATPAVAGVALIGPNLQRPVGILLLLVFGAAMAGLLVFGREQQLFESEALEEYERSRPSGVRSVLLTVAGLIALAIGGVLVAKGAEGLLDSVPIPPLLLGMVIGPLAIEAEEVIRQAVATRAGHPEVAAGNLLGTMLYFVLFNLGVIALATPVPIEPLVRSFDWPFAVAVTVLATIYLWRGGVNRWQGLTLLAAYVGFGMAHVILA